MALTLDYKAKDYEEQENNTHHRLKGQLKVAYKNKESYLKFPTLKN